MVNSSSGIFLILFALSVSIAYIAVRRNWAKPGFVGGIGFILNILFILLYSLSEGTSLFSAIGTGILLSLIFTALAVTIATFFRVNSLRSATIDESSEPTLSELSK